MTSPFQTPPPWRVSPDDPNEILGPAPDHVTVARTLMRADSPVVAAAPEAREALRAVLEWLPKVSSLPLTTETAIGNMVKQIHAILAKMDGEE